MIAVLLFACFLGLAYVGVMFAVRRALGRLTPEELGRLLRELEDDR